MLLLSTLGWTIFSCNLLLTLYSRLVQFFYDEDMNTLDTTKNISYMYICEVISNVNYAIIYLCHLGQKYFTNFCVMSNCRCMGHPYNPHMKIRGKYMFMCCSKSPLTSLLAQEKIESKSLTFWIQTRTAQTYLTQNANNLFIRTPNWVILFFGHQISCTFQPNRNHLKIHPER